MEHTLVLVYLHHGQQSISVEIFRSKVQGCYCDFWKSGVYASHYSNISGSRRTSQHDINVWACSYGTKTTTLGGAASPFNDRSSDERDAPSQG